MARKLEEEVLIEEHKLIEASQIFKTHYERTEIGRTMRKKVFTIEFNSSNYIHKQRYNFVLWDCYKYKGLI
ncbi:unnamed protein product [Moneuplotes crassus]|uniref:Uncharacterized protein n=1 Tax=Euplotes crassus TaxID=5936 RepID=A0AAD1UKH0_EUPCR|nr:unnamed protein product [Moneuplotes crassus]